MAKSQRNDKLEQPLSIYEIHFGSWKRPENGDSLSYREMADQLILVTGNELHPY